MASLQDIVSDDLNYEIWAPIVKATLVEKDLWNVVENGIPPDPSKIPELSSSIQPEELSTWRDMAGKDTKALQIIQSSLPDTVFRKTLEVASAKELWDLLKESNKQEEEAKLVKEFKETRIEEEESINRLTPDAESGLVRLTKQVISMSDSYYGAGIMPVAVMDDLVVVEQLSFVCLRELLDTFESVPVKLGYPSEDEFITRMLVSMSDEHYGPVTEEELVVPQILSFNEFREFIDMVETISVVNINAVLKGVAVLSSALEDDSPLVNKDGDSSKSRHVAKDCCSKNQRVVAPVEYHTSGYIETKENQESVPVRQVEKKQQSIKVPEYHMLAVDVGLKTYDKDAWMIYPTASNHMTPYVKYFTALDRSHKARIKLAFGDGVMSEGIGDVVIMTNKGETTTKNVLYVPKIDRNMLSIGQLTRNGYGIVMTADKCTVKDQSGRLFGETNWEDRGFFLRLKVVEGKCHH